MCAKRAGERWATSSSEAGGKEDMPILLAFASGDPQLTALQINRMTGLLMQRRVTEPAGQK